MVINSDIVTIYITISPPPPFSSSWDAGSQPGQEGMNPARHRDGRQSFSVLTGARQCDICLVPVLEERAGSSTNYSLTKILRRYNFGPGGKLEIQCSRNRGQFSGLGAPRSNGLSNLGN